MFSICSLKSTFWNICIAMYSKCTILSSKHVLNKKFPPWIYTQIKIAIVLTKDDSLCDIIVILAINQPLWYTIITGNVWQQVPISDSSASIYTGKILNNSNKSLKCLWNISPSICIVLHICSNPIIHLYYTNFIKLQEK